MLSFVSSEQLEPFLKDFFQKAPRKDGTLNSAFFLKYIIIMIQTGVWCQWMVAAIYQFVFLVL